MAGTRAAPAGETSHPCPEAGVQSDRGGASSIQPPPRPSRLTLAALTAPSLPLVALTLPLNVYLPEHFGNALGLDLATVGLIFMLVRLIDIGFDPLIGGVMDRTRTRWGRFRPWLAVSAPILMIGVAMLFFARPGVGPIYLAAWLAVVYAAYSVATLAQLALAAGLSSEYNERSRVYAWWQSANTLGAVVVLLFPAMVLRFAGGKGDTVALMGWLIVMVTPITFLLALWKVREAGSTGRPARAGPLEYFKLLRRPSIRIILTIDLLLGIGAGISGASMIFFMTLNKGLDRSAIGALLICYLLAATVSTGLWTWLGGRIQKHRALAVSALMHAIGVALVFFAPRGNLAILYLAMAFTGAPYGGNTILPRSMIADAGDEERLAFGVDRTGMLYAWITSVFKIGSALAIGSTFLILEWAGFKASAGMGNLAAALDMVAFLYCGVPIGMAIIAAGLATRYPLTAARHAGIRAALAQRDLDEAAARARENPGDQPAATSPPG